MTSKAIYVIPFVLVIALYLFLFYTGFKAFKVLKVNKSYKDEALFNIKLEGLKKKYKIYKKFYRDMRKSNVEPRVLQFKRRKRD